MISKPSLNRLMTVIFFVLTASSYAFLSSRPEFLLNHHNSDVGIVVLMANNDSIGIESLYYWGQDRLSGVAYGLLALIHQVTGMHWQPKGMLLLEAVWLALTLPLMAFWTRNLGWALVTCAWMIATPLRIVLFDLAQPYAWQWVWLLLAFLALSRLVECLKTPDEKRRLWWWGSIFAFATWQAHWANRLSGLVILGCVLWEILSDKSAMRRLALGLIPPWGLAFGLEEIVRAIAKRYAKKVLGASIATRMETAFPTAPEAFQKAFDHFSNWALKGALILCIGVIIYSVLSIARKTNPAFRLPRPVFYVAMLVTVNFLSLPFIRHIQENGVNERYFVLAVTFAPLPVLFLFAEGLKRTAFTTRWGPALVLGTALCVAVAMSFLLPLTSTANDFQRHSAVAAQLSAATPPTAFFAAGYWETYAVSSLAPPGRLRGIARPGQYHRTRHWNSALDDIGTVWVGTEGFDSPPERAPYNAFFPHLVVGRTLFKADEGVQPLFIGEKEYRRYIKHSSSLSGQQMLQVCDDMPYMLDASAFQSMWLFSDLVGEKNFDVAQNNLPLEPAAIEGYLTCWPVDGRRGLQRISFNRKDADTPCAYVYVFGSAVPCLEKVAP